MNTKFYSNHANIFSGEARWVIVLLIGIATTVTGQVSIGGTPPSFSLYVPDILQTETTPLVDAAALLIEDDLERGKDVPFRFGTEFACQ